MLTGSIKAALLNGQMLSEAPEVALAKTAKASLAEKKT